MGQLLAALMGLGWAWCCSSTDAALAAPLLLGVPDSLRLLHVLSSTAQAAPPLPGVPASPETACLLHVKKLLRRYGMGQACWRRSWAWGWACCCSSTRTASRWARRRLR